MRIMVLINRLFFCCCLLLIAACAQDEEGCLDVRAKNFDIEADKNCCCDYPIMNLEISPIFGSDALPFRLGSPYSYPSGPVFKVLENQFFLRNVVLTDAGGSVFRISDDLDICYKVNGSEETANLSVTDDVFKFRLGNLRSEVGTYPDAGTYDAIGFTLGLGDTLRNVCRNDLPNGHPLTDNQMIDPVGSALLDLRLIVIPDTLLAEDTLYLETEMGVTDVNISGTFIIQERADFLIPLSIDYMKWFEGINFSNENEENIVKQLESNFNSAWLLKN
jgi:hypothetical protein